MPSRPKKMQRNRNLNNNNGKGAKSVGSKSTGASNSITPPLSSEQQEQKRKLMQEITQFTKALGQTSGGKDPSNSASNINSTRLRSGRTIPKVTHVPTPYPSEHSKKNSSESVETDDHVTRTGLQQQNNLFVANRNPSVAEKSLESVNTSSNRFLVTTRVPITRSMKRATESESRESSSYPDTVEQEVGYESGTDSGTIESVLPNRVAQSSLIELSQETAGQDRFQPQVKLDRVGTQTKESRVQTPMVTEQGGQNPKPPTNSSNITVLRSSSLRGLSIRERTEKQRKEKPEEMLHLKLSLGNRFRNAREVTPTRNADRETDNANSSNLTPDTDEAQVINSQLEKRAQELRQAKMTKKGVQWEQAEVVVHAVSPPNPFREFERIQSSGSSGQDEEDSVDSATHYQVPTKRQRPNRPYKSNVSVSYEPEIEIYETITPIEEDSRNESTTQEQNEYQLAHNVAGSVEQEETEEELINSQSSQPNRLGTHENQSKHEGDYVNMSAWTHQNKSRSKSRTGRMYDSWYKRRDEEENYPDRPPPSKTPDPKKDPKGKSWLVEYNYARRAFCEIESGKPISWTESVYLPHEDVTLNFDLNEQAYLPRIGFDEYSCIYMYTDTLRSLPVEVFVGGDPSPKGHRDTEKFLQMLRRSRETRRLKDNRFIPAQGRRQSDSYDSDLSAANTMSGRVNNSLSRENNNARYPVRANALEPIEKELRSIGEKQAKFLKDRYQVRPPRPGLYREDNEQVRGNTLENSRREDVDIPHQEMIIENNRQNSQEGGAESSDELSSNQSQGSMIAEGVRIMNDVFLVMENQERRSEWSSTAVLPIEIETASNIPLWVQDLFSQFHATNQVLNEYKEEKKPMRLIELAAGKLAEIMATIHSEALDCIPIFMRMFAIQKEVEYKVMSNIMMLDLEEVSDYLDTRGLHTEVTKVVDKFETHFEELKRAKKDVMARASQCMYEASRLLIEEPVNLNQQVGILRRVMRLRSFNESIITKDASMKEDLFKTLTGWRELRWKTGTPFRPESSLRDPARKLDYPRNAIVQTSPIEMRNQAVGQTPGQEANIINSRDWRTTNDTPINNDNARVTNVLLTNPTGSYTRQGINLSDRNQTRVINQKAQLQTNNYHIRRVNPTSENNREMTPPNSHDQTGYCDRDKDGNYTPLHINIAPCSGINNKQTHELSEGRTQITKDRQTSEIEEQSQHAIETGELQSNQVQRPQVDNRLAQVDNRLEVSTQLGGEACAICRRADHTTIECQAVRRPGWCFICGKTDHDTPHCLSRYNTERRGSNGQSSNTYERQPVRPPPRNMQVNTNPSLTQNQMQECGYVQVQENQGRMPSQPPIPPNMVLTEQQGRKFFSGQVEQGQQGGFYGYYLPQASQQQIEAWHSQNSKGMWNQTQEVQVDTSRPPPPIARPPPATTPIAGPVERNLMNVPPQYGEENSPPKLLPRQTVVKKVKIDTTTTPREWTEIQKLCDQQNRKFRQKTERLESEEEKSENEGESDEDERRRNKYRRDRERDRQSRRGDSNRYKEKDRLRFREEDRERGRHRTRESKRHRHRDRDRNPSTSPSPSPKRHQNWYHELAEKHGHDLGSREVESTEEDSADYGHRGEKLFNGRIESKRRKSPRKRYNRDENTSRHNYRMREGQESETESEWEEETSNRVTNKWSKGGKQGEVNQIETGKNYAAIIDAQLLRTIPVFDGSGETKVEFWNNELKKGALITGQPVTKLAYMYSTGTPHKRISKFLEAGKPWSYILERLAELYSDMPTKIHASTSMVFSKQHFGETLDAFVERFTETWAKATGKKNPKNERAEVIISAFIRNLYNKHLKKKLVNSKGTSNLHDAFETALAFQKKIQKMEGLDYVSEVDKSDNSDDEYGKKTREVNVIELSKSLEVPQPQTNPFQANGLFLDMGEKGLHEIYQVSVVEQEENPKKTYIKSNAGVIYEVEKQETSKPVRSVDSIMCYKCGVYGHYSFRCPMLKNNQNQQTVTPVIQRRSTDITEQGYIPLQIQSTPPPKITQQITSEAPMRADAWAYVQETLNKFGMNNTLIESSSKLGKSTGKSEPVPASYGNRTSIITAGTKARNTIQVNGGIINLQKKQKATLQMEERPKINKSWLSRKN